MNLEGNIPMAQQKAPSIGRLALIIGESCVDYDQKIFDYELAQKEIDEAMNGWWPIDTAPTDTDVLIFIPGYGQEVANKPGGITSMYWFPKSREARGVAFTWNGATHWQPLRKPPEVV